MPFGLGDRRLGEPEPELAPSPEPPTIGRAMGAMGRVMGPGPDNESPWAATDPRRPVPGASMGGAGTLELITGLGLGGPMGEGAADGIFTEPASGTPIGIGMRLKLGSNDGPALKPRARPDGSGVPGGGCIFAGLKEYCIGAKLPTRGDILGGGIMTGP